jgi:hypothetical protein
MNPQRAAVDEVSDVVTQRIDEMSSRRAIEADEIDDCIRSQRADAAPERPVLLSAFAIYHDKIAVFPFVACVIRMS